MKKEGIKIRMSSPSGQTYSSSWKAKEGMAMIEKIKIIPGSEIERILTLEDWNISPGPGDYIMVISFKYKALVGAVEEQVMQPVTIQLKVAGRDASLIRSECDLADSLFLNARYYTEA
jgi:hypothetical protein